MPLCLLCSCGSIEHNPHRRRLLLVPGPGSAGPQADDYQTSGDWSIGCELSWIFFSAASPFLPCFASLYQIQSERYIPPFTALFPHSNTSRSQWHPRRTNSKMVCYRPRSFFLPFPEARRRKSCFVPATTGPSAGTATIFATVMGHVPVYHLMAMASFYTVYDLHKRCFELSGACRKMSHFQTQLTAFQ